MMLNFYKPEPVRLKGHAEFNEKWVQQRIKDDPSILGLGDVELVAAEKVQPKAGRLDLLLHDDQLNRRYEVELMLGATDPSHIMRTIEYWDIERRRYPAYDHVSVLVAEDVTARFLNLISLLAGSIPLIAIQMSALRIQDKIVLHFTRVLDQTELRSDDEWELGGDGVAGPQLVDRNWWQQRVPESVLGVCDEVLDLVTAAAREPQQMQYRKKVVNLVAGDGTARRVWLVPKVTLIRVGAYVTQPETWVKRFEEAGLTADLRRGNKAVAVTLTPESFPTQKPLMTEFIGDAFAEDQTEP